MPQEANILGTSPDPRLEVTKKRDSSPLTSVTHFDIGRTDASSMLNVKRQGFVTQDGGNDSALARTYCLVIQRN